MHARRFSVVVPLLLAFSACAADSPVDRIKLLNFKVTLQDESLLLFLDIPGHASLQNENPTEIPVLTELGVQLTNYSIDFKNAKDLGQNKIGFGGETTMELKNTEGEEKCLEVEWHTSDPKQVLEDCFPMRPHNWFGGPEQSDQLWPIEKAIFEEYSYVTKAENNQAIAEPYWLNSDGFMIYVDPTVPLFIDQNHHMNETLCLLAKHDSPYLRKGGASLKYTMCKFDNPRIAHEFAVERFLGKPSGIPDTRMVQHPIWSTWAKYKTHIDEEIVMQYAKEIVDNGFNNSQLEIDDMWETCYGSLSFNETQFPNMKKLVTKLDKMGFRTTIWVHPFINLDCDIHKDAQKKGYLVKNTEGNTTTRWWNGDGSYIDFTNPAAADWFEKRLRNMLNESGINSLKFDAGESSWLPQIPILNGSESEQPEIITQKYVELAAKFGSMIEVRSGKRTQHLPIFVRMLDRDSVWGYSLGLHSVITATFEMNFNGYPFVLPDMVGGNAYNSDKVSKEMFVRYLQTNVFLPSIQFSIPPWDYDDETISLSKKYTALHFQYSDIILALMKKAVETGQPINTPIWWVDPTNKETFAINTEYMLGEDILVAPVLDEGAIKRDIYLPKGQWRDEAKPDKPVITGPVWLHDYPAPLDTLPYFTRVNSGSGQILLAILPLAGVSCFLIIFR